MSLRTRSRSIKETPESPMEGIRTAGSQGQGEEEPLIEKPAAPPPPPPPTRSQQALSLALASTAHLAKLLPTGTLLAFQLLTPFCTNNGSCDAVTRPMTQLMLLLLALFSFLACFTDSFGQDGRVYYGFATLNGMWLFDYPDAAAASGLPDLTKYRLRLRDFVHGVLTVLVFGAVALGDKNVVNCFYPHPEHETQEVLNVVPLGIGLLCSSLFVVFPTRRHGIGYPATNGREMSN